MTKKVLLILGILIIIGAAAYLILGGTQQQAGDSRVGFSLGDFFPFGKNNSTNEEITTDGAVIQNQETETPPMTETNQPIPRLRKISKEPVAGAVIYNVGTTSLVRFVEKGTGNVYEVRSNSLTTERLTNTTIPKIIRGYWLPDASGFLAQTLVPESEIVETSFVKLIKNKATTSNEILTPYSTTISKLPTGIKEIAIRSDGKKIFYYITNNSASSWFISNPDGTEQSVVLTHPLTEWLPKWISTDTIIMQSRSSSESVGYTYSFDVKNKTLKKVGVGLVGLSANTNNDGTLSIVSGGGNFPQIFLINNKEVSVSELAAGGMAEKCVWTKEKVSSVYCAIPSQIPTGNYPDIWYKGLVSTQDFIEKIDVSNKIYTRTADLFSLSQEKIDAVDLSLSPDETHLVFRNKIDGFSWLLRVAR
jgi:hypothetical protein